MVTTRHDIAFSVGYLSRYFSNPTKAHWQAAKRVIRYLSSTPRHGILYKAQKEVKLDVYSDADYAADTVTRQSTSGVICLVNDAPIVWTSHRQKTLSLSTTESELKAACLGIRESVWLQQCVSELLVVKVPINLWIDNISTLYVIDNETTNGRTKHIDIEYKYILETTRTQDIAPKYISTKIN